MTNSDSNSSVIILSGMHRSGTSLTASLLENAGVNIGDRLMESDRGNVKGHFEDWDFVEFHQNVLQSQGISIAGWTENSSIEVQQQYLLPAQNLILARQDRPIWGWKDPRTCLFLDFWRSLIPDANYIFIFRSPWQVVDSLFRRGDVIFRTNPNFAVQQWCKYNQTILDFYQRYPEQCILWEVSSIINNHKAFIDTVKQKFELDLRSPESTYEPSLFHGDLHNDYRQALVTKFFPQATELYQQLQQVAEKNDGRVIEPQAIDLTCKSWILQDWVDLKLAIATQGEGELALIEVQQQLGSKESAYFNAQQQLESKDGELISLQQQLESKDGELINAQQQLKSQELELASTQQQLESHNLELASTQQQLESYKLELATTQQQLELKDRELTNAQQQLELKDRELASTQQQLESKDRELASTQQQLESKNSELSNAQEFESQHISTYQELEHLLNKLNQSEKQLQITQMETEKLRSLVVAMESSKFWQLRQSWFAVKSKLRIKSSDLIYQDYLASIEQNSVSDRSTPVSPEIAPLDKHIQKLKRNFPQKETLKKIASEVSKLSHPGVVDIKEAAKSRDAKYQKWLEQNYPKPGELSKIREASLTLAYQPLVSVIVPVYNSNPDFLRQAIASVLEQAYPNWELCLADDCSTQPHVREILEEYAEKDPRIKIVLRNTNGHICRTSNSAIEIATGEYIALLDHDDLLAPHALARVVELLNEHPEADFIYSDEDKVDEKNLHQDPFFKPDWCPDSFLSRMYTCHLGVYRRSLVNEIGNFREGYEGSQDYDLVLRVTEKTNNIYHIPDVLYHWRIHLESTAADSNAKPYAADAAQKAIAEAIVRRGEPGEVKTHSSFAGIYTVRYQIEDPKLVSIIIPTKDLADTLDVCLRSIFTKTTYPNYEVVVIDNGSTEDKTQECFAYWQQQQGDRFKCYRYDVPFNYSQINNYAVVKAQGDYLLFLNNDTEVITSDWLTAMVEQVQRPTIGAVGGLLLYPDDTIQHAGVVLGIGGVAGHSHKHFHVSQPGYISQLASTNNYSAVTGACLMCRREVFKEIGGFEEKLAIAFNDVDLCLKIASCGYRNIYLPHVVLYHYESKSRGYEDTPAKQARFAQEVTYMKQKWQELCDRDPCYNPNLTLCHEDYSLNI